MVKLRLWCNTRAMAKVVHYAVPVITAAAVTASTLSLLASADTSFVSHPVSVVLLGGAAVFTALLASRLLRTGVRALAGWAVAASASLSVYLVLGAIAVGSQHPVVIAVWGAAWIPPLGLASICATSSVHRPGVRTAAAWIVLGLTAVTTIGWVITQRPEAPFSGIDTIAPKAWADTAGSVGTGVFVAWLGALFASFTVLALASLSSRGAARSRLGFAAISALLPVLAIAVCVLLAISRDPGELDASTGSVAFVATLSACCALSLLAAVLARAESVDPRAVRGLVTTTVAGFASVGTVTLGTLAASSLAGAGAATVAIATAAIAAAAVAAGWIASAALVRALTPPPPAVASGTRVPGLSPREQEVLGLLAQGASNAGIAAQLVISERTVDAHLRSIFTKLDLEGSTASSRRVQAARVWLESTR